MGHGSAGSATAPTPHSNSPQQRGSRPFVPARPTATPSHSTVRRHPGFTDAVIAAAQASQRQTGIPASITLAQFGFESGYGRSMPPGSNNPFGIKAKPGEPFVLAHTLEEVGGRKIPTIAKFKIYKSLAEAFTDHARVLQSPIYDHARSARTSAEFTDRLTHVYASDSRYGSVLKSIIRHNNLDELNVH